MNGVTSVCNALDSSKLNSGPKPIRGVAELVKIEPGAGASGVQSGPLPTAVEMGVPGGLRRGVWGDADTALGVADILGAAIAGSESVGQLRPAIGEYKENLVRADALIPDMSWVDAWVSRLFVALRSAAALTGVRAGDCASGDDDEPGSALDMNCVISIHHSCTRSWEARGAVAFQRCPMARCSSSSRRRWRI